MPTYNVINEILKAMNNRISGGGILCDLMRACDCVNHGILVDKVEFYGISGKYVTLIQSYVRGRYQKVLTYKTNAYNGFFSRWKKVTNGDLLLFLVYINDLPKITENDAKVVLLQMVLAL